MTIPTNDEPLIPLEPGQAVSRGWTAATDFRPLAVTWHWTATWDLAHCRRLLGGSTAERKGEASAHYGIGRSWAEGIDRYVALENRSWHAGKHQTLRWDGRALDDDAFKDSRTAIGSRPSSNPMAKPRLPMIHTRPSEAEPSASTLRRPSISTSTTHSIIAASCAPMAGSATPSRRRRWWRFSVMAGRGE
ncbi:MAG: hypothetical protein HC897_19745 [Thermoanaerobaculia bacterium]|nr:hypothetical protein [Thermoanaerobaculia bacterium]